MNVNLEKEALEPIYVSYQQAGVSHHYYLPSRKIAFTVRGEGNEKTIDAYFTSEYRQALNLEPGKVSEVGNYFFPSRLADKIHLTIMGKLDLFKKLSPHENVNDDFNHSMIAIEAQQKKIAVELDMLSLQVSNSVINESSINQYGTFILPRKPERP